jgi:hypothetical protein
MCAQTSGEVQRERWSSVLSAEPDARAYNDMLLGNVKERRSAPERYSPLSINITTHTACACPTRSYYVSLVQGGSAHLSQMVPEGERKDTAAP